MELSFAGNVTADPELSFTPNGAARCAFTVAVNSGYRDASGQWKESDPIFQRVIAWRGLGEHLAASVKKGCRVVVTGRLSSRSWEGEKGERHYITEVAATDVGVSLRYATAEVTKVERETAKVA